MCAGGRTRSEIKLEMGCIRMLCGCVLAHGGWNVLVNSKGIAEMMGEGAAGDRHACSEISRA
jgi:hypothetical protein